MVAPAHPAVEPTGSLGVASTAAKNRGRGCPFVAIRNPSLPTVPFGLGTSMQEHAGKQHEQPQDGGRQNERASDHAPGLSAGLRLPLVTMPSLDARPTVLLRVLGSGSPEACSRRRRQPSARSPNRVPGLRPSPTGRKGRERPSERTAPVPPPGFLDRNPPLGDEVRERPWILQLRARSQLPLCEAPRLEAGP